jgi:hypothetical protein
MQMNKLTVTDFSKRNKGYGQWELTYTSPISRNQWSCHYTESKNIDMLFNHESDNKPTMKFLLYMKKYIKTNGRKINPKNL